MNTRQALEASLAAPPVEISMRNILVRVEFDEVLRKLRIAAAMRNWPRVSALLERAARLYLSIPTGEDMSQATVQEAATSSLIAELRRRATQEKDREAAKVLRPTKTRVRQ